MVRECGAISRRSVSKPAWGEGATRCRSAAERTRAGERAARPLGWRFPAGVHRKRGSWRADRNRLLLAARKAETGQDDVGYL